MEHRSYTFKDIFGIIVLVVIFALIPIGVYLESKQTAFFSKADVSTKPLRIKTSNISDNSFTISWVTPGKPTSGFVSYGKSPDLGYSMFDERDSDVRVERVTHSVTLKNLDPQTKYYYKIGSSGTIYDNNGVPYEVSTAPISLNSPPLTKFISGKIIKRDGTVVNEAIVYLTTSAGYLQSAVARGENWTIPLHKIRSTDLVSYLELEDSDNLDLYIESGDSTSIKKTVHLNDQQDSLTISL